MAGPPNHRGAHARLVVFALAALAGRAHAIDAIVITAREVEVAGVPVQGATVTLELPPGEQTRLTVGARALTFPTPAGRLVNVAFVCNRPLVAEPTFGCDSGRLTANGGPTGAI